MAHPVTYKIETDLINPEGPKSITVPGLKTVNYDLKLTPKLGGSFTGSITFIDQNDNNNYTWYTVQMIIDRSEAMKTIDISTVVRKPVVVDIEIFNPEKMDLTMEVLIHGEGLKGENFFEIKQKSSSVYELMYLPLRVGKQVGMITFLNELLGEIWYEISMEAEMAPVVRLS